MVSNTTGGGIVTRKLIEVRDIDKIGLDELDDLFFTEKKLGDPLIVEGNLVWKKWMRNNLEKYNSIGKVAYLDSKIVGIIQYIPKPEQKVVEIKWIFVDGPKSNEDIKESLLKETIKEFKRPKSYFGHEKAKGLVTYFNSLLRSYKDENFYQKNGFRPLSEEDGNLLYYPLREDSNFLPDSANLPVDESNGDEVLVLCNPINPYCLKEALDTLREVRKMAPNLSIKLFAIVDESKELNHAFSIPVSLVVNNSILDSSSIDSEDFLGELRSADYNVEVVQGSKDRNEPSSEDVHGDHDRLLLYS